MTAPIDFMLSGSTVLDLVQGPANIYIGVFGATEPADSAVASPPSSSDWTDIGGTLDGVTVTIKQEYKELDCDQIVDIPGRRLVKRDVNVKIKMAEPTLSNLVYILNDGTSTSGSGFNNLVPAFTDAATQPTYRAMLIHGWSPGNGSGGQSKRRMIIMRRCLCSDDIEFSYQKDKQTVFSTSWSIHYDSNTVAPFKIVDET